MDISPLASVASSLSQAKVGDAVGTLVLKKAMDIQAQSAMQMIEALPQVASNPPNLGNSVDVRA